MYRLARKGPATGGVDAALTRIDRYVRAAIRVQAFPGAALGFGRVGEEPVVRCYGHLTHARRHPVTPRTLYDLLCLTKPMVVASLVARAVDEGALDLDAPVAETLPPFGAAGKGRISWADLLAHGGGLAPSRSYARLVGATREQLIATILGQRPLRPPGTRYEYSCDGYVVLGLALARRAGRPLDQLARSRIFEPLGMGRAAYAKPHRPFGGDVAPTRNVEVKDGAEVRGRVCEPLARALDGVAGSAGLFGCIEDVARFARAWLGEPGPGGRPFFGREVLERFRRPVDPVRLDTRALGWDTRSPEGYTVAGRTLGPRSFGHTGASGCSLWLDPDEGIWVALLSNAIHGDRGRRRYVHVRPRVSDLATAALRAGAKASSAAR